MSCRSRCRFLPLAHVEYYFADLLSVMESGRDPETGLTREAMRLDCPEDAEGELPPAQLHLPPNLYVIGTVNVDETTQAFSPKVRTRHHCPRRAGRRRRRCSRSVHRSRRVN